MIRKIPYSSNRYFSVQTNMLINEDIPWFQVNLCCLRHCVQTT